MDNRPDMMDKAVNFKVTIQGEDESFMSDQVFSNEIVLYYQ